MSARPKPRDNVVPLRPLPDLNAAYRATVSVHFPNSDELSLSLRSELMALRDRTSAALRRCRAEAEPTLMEANRLASLTALADVPTRTLAFTKLAVDSLLFSAQMLQRAAS